MEELMMIMRRRKRRRRRSTPPDWVISYTDTMLAKTVYFL